MRRRRRVVLGVGVVLVALVVVACTVGPTGVRRVLIDWFTPEYTPEGDPGALAPTFPAPDDARQRVDIGLDKVADGFTLPVDIQFVPGHPDVMLVVEQPGNVVRVGPQGRRQLLHVEVVHGGEQGLLGLAFHPDYAANGRFFLNATVAGPERTQITSWTVPPGDDLARAVPTLEHVVLELEQPYQNHNAGQLAFGPDGMLYVGVGDGGFVGDPHGHGQNTATLLGAMLRLDVAKAPYEVPPDNPFVGRDGFRPEIWAYGLRNPWRYTFSPDGELVVADVGQDLWEEVTVVGRGENHGWKTREGAHCFPPDATCSRGAMTDPIWEYPRQEGASITGGYFYAGKRVPALVGAYVFADFVSGRIWALDIAAGGPPRTLGKWPLLPSTFGRDAGGELYVANYGAGVVYRIGAPQ